MKKHIVILIINMKGNGKPHTLKTYIADHKFDILYHMHGCRVCRFLKREIFLHINSLEFFQNKSIDGKDIKPKILKKKTSSTAVKEICNTIALSTSQTLIWGDLLQANLEKIKS